MDQRPQAAPSRSFRHFLPITKRWMDNDVYGHVSSVVYCSYFDTVVNEHLLRNGVFARGDRRPMTLPAPLRAALERIAA